MTEDQPDALPGTNGRRRIYLMRHGDVNYFKPDGTRVDDSDQVSLTEEGQAQARAMSGCLATVPFDLAIHTGLRRTRETAEIVLGGRPIELVERGSLREIRTGPVDDIPPERLDAEFTYGMEAAAEPGARFARGELYAEFYERITSAFDALVREPGWRTLLLVAHGGTNRMILGWAVKTGLAGISCFEQDTACLNVLDVDVIEGEIVRRYLRTLNLTPYNLPKHELYLTTLERMSQRRRLLKEAATR